ncbi:MAG: hypothetical protein K2X99_02800, partial [Gemmatimonadaceae bacterium]|nr:hypothetical protein [Gemmatimonadaceae bacterium]
MPRPDDLLHRDVPFAVVDVETTGTGTLQGDRITDIAIVQVLGGHVVEHFASLVNPERRIPMHITRLTGIDDAMVADAPVFRDVAPAIERALQQRVFVAHNVAFDWGFVNGELLRAQRDTLS